MITVGSLLLDFGEHVWCFPGGMTCKVQKIKVISDDIVYRFLGIYL